MTTYTVLVAYYDRDCRATVNVEAESYEEACEKAIAAVDDGDIETDVASWDPMPSFVYGAVQGEDEDPWDGTKNVPPRFAEGHWHGLLANVTTPQRDAILAGLRLLAVALTKGEVEPNDGDIGSILTNAGGHEGMSPDDIHDLADRINQ
jgi:hypothetical protein